MPDACQVWPSYIQLTPNADGDVGDALPPQVAVTTAAPTTVMQRARLDFTFRAPPMTMLTKTAILPLAGRRFNAGVATNFLIPRHSTS